MTLKSTILMRRNEELSKFFLHKVVLKQTTSSEQLFCWMWWCTPIILVLERLRQEECESRLA
jgi:hypothetical protein